MIDTDLTSGPISGHFRRLAIPAAVGMLFSTLYNIVMLPAGARVPVDGELITASALLDRSILTGETAAVDAKAGAILQAGEINLSAPFQMRATAVGEDSSLRRMAALVETAEHARNSYTALADRAAAIYAPAVHLLALAAFLGWMIYSGDARLSINIAIAVLIITCPCALGLAVPAVSTAGCQPPFQSRFFSQARHSAGADCRGGLYSVRQNRHADTTLHRDTCIRHSRRPRGDQGTGAGFRPPDVQSVDGFFGG